MEWNRIESELNGIKWNRIRNRIEWNQIEWNRMESNGIEWNRMESD